jgi:glycosyltransferase involved in cell wall biosynthesis
MLLIDAATISDGGGYGLLELLVTQLSSSDVNFRVIARPGLKLSAIPEEHIYRRKVGLRNRNKVISDLVEYSKASNLLCFCNFPPPARYTGVRTYTYFHRPGLIEQHNFGLRTILRITKYSAMVWYLKSLLPNTDLVLCQSKEVVERFAGKFSYPVEKLKVLPYYDELLIREVAAQSFGRLKKEAFIYVSNDALHKNHKRLLAAWKLLASRKLFPKLLLTLPEHNEYQDQIDDINSVGGSVINLGLTQYRELLLIVADCKYAIYPSLQESLGLGLVEAAVLGVSVIGADLPYTFKAINPSATFNPFLSASIAQSVEKILTSEILHPTELVIENRLMELIKLITS